MVVVIAFVIVVVILFAALMAEVFKADKHLKKESEKLAKYLIEVHNIEPELIKDMSYTALCVFRDSLDVKYPEACENYVKTQTNK